eukprot:Colp12_sorted_trinity150504_noHs@15830
MHVTHPAAVLQTSGRGVQRHVVRECSDAPALQLHLIVLAHGQGRQQHEEDVRVALAVRRYHGHTQRALGGQLLQTLRVDGEVRAAPGADVVHLLELRPQHRAGQLVGHEGRAQVHPLVLVNLAHHEVVPVGALLPHHERSRSAGRVAVDRQRSTLATNDVLRVVKRVAAKVTNSTELAALVSGHEALGSVLDDKEVVSLRDLADGVHFAGDAGIVHAADGASALGHSRLDEGFVDVQRVDAHVHKDRHHAAQHEAIRGGGEGVRGEDYLVPGLQLAQQGRHLQRRSARGNHHHALGFLSDELANARGALHSEVRGGVETGVEHLCDVRELLAGEVLPAERDRIRQIGSDKRRDQVVRQPCVVYFLQNVLPEAEALVAGTGGRVVALRDHVDSGGRVIAELLEGPEHRSAQKRICDASSARLVRHSQQADVDSVAALLDSDEAQLLGVGGVR